MSNLNLMKPEVIVIEEVKLLSGKGRKAKY